MLFSVIFFLLTIIVYYRSKRLNSCHGKCFMFYLINLTIQYALISFVNLTHLEFGEMICIGVGKIAIQMCTIVNHFNFPLPLGYSIYISTIGFLTWTCIISYHTYMTLCRIHESITFRKYLAWGLCVPILSTILIYWVQSLDDVEDALKPGIESKMCGVRSEYFKVIEIILQLFYSRLSLQLIAGLPHSIIIYRI